ncbi:MAG: CotH kinase family protein [Sphingobacteriaceae bacterium]|nr:CotH kinase family protein [Sphingobacteriaceae bacterium]
MRNFTLVFIALFFSLGLIKAQAPFGPLASTQAVTLTLDSSKLPIVALKLPFLLPANDPIPDTPKVTVGMGIINNGYNVMNHITDVPNGYKGQIGIEKRGSISQTSWFLQKSYGLETRDISGADSDAVILGMPIEHDWILYGPYDDESLMRNTLIYQLGRDMGYYTPRAKYCEVQFYNYLWQPDYRGIYIMMEKIKRDANRVNISKLTPIDNTGDDVTGGYIFAVDKNIWANDSGWISLKDAGVFFSYKYPKSDDITIQQKNYLKAYVDSFETALQGPNFMSPTIGYKKYIDHNTFIDFFFMQEISKSIDAFRRSAYLYKDKNSKGGKIKAGPLWDFNSAMYNVKLCAFEQDTGWAYKSTCWINSAYHVPFWWGRLLQDSNYTKDLKCRWAQLRSTTLDTTHIFKIIDSIKTYVSDASVRHFLRFDINTNLQIQCDTLKWWLKKRLAWLDSKMPGLCTTIGLSEKKCSKIHCRHIQIQRRGN